MGQHVAVQLTGEERNTLEQRLKGGQDKARSQTRARVLLLLDLPELLLEIHGATGCLDAFDLASEGTSRAADIHLSVAAVLVAQACNIGLKAVSQPGSPALNLHRLAWVQQNYFRPETLEKVNIRLVNYHASLELAHKWGGGEVASADGLRFLVPVRSIYTGYNSKYFGSKKGLTLYHFVSDQFSGGCNSDLRGGESGVTKMVLGERRATRVTSCPQGSHSPGTRSRPMLS